MKRRIFRWMYHKASPNSIKGLLGFIYGVTELAGWKEALRLFNAIRKEGKNGRIQSARSQES